VVWWAARHGVPTTIRSRTPFPAWPPACSAPAFGVYLGLPEARAVLRFGKGTEVFDAGNPITPPTPERRIQALSRFQLSGARPVVLVTGGSQGALAINRAVAGWLDTGDPPRPISSG
jgi:UDP-N-acetylglucosamine--N-acetylmuramyl-(pentapeptide) pyrophosphoryl-undecaprenol N-acetylglucosamine transferase